MKCPHCGKSVKGHADGKLGARELTRAQLKASIAKTARDLKALQKIYAETAPAK